VPADVRAYWTARLAADGLPALHAELTRRDPAHSLRPTDRQRILRALEVLEATGRPLADWRSANTPPLLPAAGSRRLLVEPPRAVLHRRIADRLGRMVSEGALDEVRSLLARGIDASLPAMKAIGARELSAALRGDLPLAGALAQTETETRRYAKRQSTWFRNQMRGWEKIEA
jgi:tRNA dimethylallyltransferase